jgi:hypothetical protein
VRRQCNEKTRACAGRGRDANASAVLLDDLEADRQPKSGALADRLGGEEWIEDALQVFLRNAFAIVLDCDQQVVPDRMRAQRDASLCVLDGLRRIRDQGSAAPD